MHWLLIVGVSLAVVGFLVAVGVAILINRLNRWADAMILSFGMLELRPPEPGAAAEGKKSEASSQHLHRTHIHTSPGIWKVLTEMILRVKHLRSPSKGLLSLKQRKARPC